MAARGNYFLKNIFIYPIKSLGGIALNSSFTEEKGLPYDRRWLLVDQNNNFLTQRKYSKMALLKVKLNENSLEISHSKNTASSVTIPFEIKNAEPLAVNIWDEFVTARSILDPEIIRWFSSELGEEVKLVYMDEQASRQVDNKYAANNEEVSFADGFPYLVTNQASLDELNSRMVTPIPMDRFRPNLVVEGALPFEEDRWKQIRIGEAVLDVVKPSGRCKVITIDQATAEKNDEPLIALNKFRKINNKVIFGQNLLLRTPGKINLGDPIEILYH